MKGIDPSRPVTYCHASMRYFKEKEHHVTRVCGEDVLLLVYEGCLRFVEDDVPYEIGPGQYHIQKQGSRQSGPLASNAPWYLFVHFLGSWGEGPGMLSADGTFSSEHLFGLMEKMDYFAHGDYTQLERTSVFLQLLCTLYQSGRSRSLAGEIAEHLVHNLQNPDSLETLARKFGYSKNHIIHLFKKEFQVTPIDYLTTKRLEKVRWLLEAGNEPIETIAEQCGFSDYSHLYKAFVRKEGISPGQWRHRHQISPF